MLMLLTGVFSFDRENHLKFDILGFVAMDVFLPVRHFGGDPLRVFESRHSLVG
jgi:hypothetical protein